MQLADRGVAVAAEEDRDQMRVDEDADQEPGPGDVLVVEFEVLVGEPGGRNQDAQTEGDRRGQQEKDAVVDRADDDSDRTPTGERSVVLASVVADIPRTP